MESVAEIEHEIPLNPLGIHHDLLLLPWASAELAIDETLLPNSLLKCRLLRALLQPFSNEQRQQASSQNPG